MFSGKYTIKINSRYQFTPPPRFGQFLSAGAVVTQGFDHNLMVMTRQSFLELTSKVMSLNLMDPAARSLSRMLLGNAMDSDLDTNGRITLPKNLCQGLNLGSQAILVGAGNFLELWPSESWEKQEDSFSQFKADANRFSSLDLRLN